jgi:lipopolysaccharide transport protein LptA/LPS export ABC transporter protein LptC
MQRTVRLLRIALPILFVVFVAILFYSWDATKNKIRKSAAEPVPSPRGIDRPIAEAKTFRDVQTIGGRVVSEIVAERVVPFESGWTTLEGVTLTLYRANGLTYVVSCPQAQFNSQTKEADAKGGVRVTSSDGIEIATAQVRYDGSRLTNDIPVQFRVDRWTGNAGALDLDVQGETLRLSKDVNATMAPAAPGEAPMNIRGAETTFRRADNTIEFKDRVAMNRGADNVHADWMTGKFTQDRKRIIALEGRGHALIVIGANPAPGEDLGGRKTISCDLFFTEVGPDGQISAFNAQSAENIAHAILDGPPRRDIVARTFRVAIANRLVSEIKADFEVVMKEGGPMPRQVNTDHATLSFDPVTRHARSAFLDGSFRYTDPKNTASAFRANYDIVGDRIVLTTDAGWQATVVSDGQILKAKTLEFSPRAQTAHAIGSVIAQLVSRGKTGGAAASADATSLFPAGKPVFVNSDDLILRQTNKVAVFTGNVKAWQDNNTILANELQMQGNGEIVTARGNVRTILYNTTADARKTPVKSESESLVAKKLERRIDLLGKVSIVDETRNLKSEKATFFLDEKNKIQKIEAEQNVNVVEAANGRKGTGDRAIYQVDKKMIYVFGSPATITDPSGSVSGQQIVFDLTRNRVQVVSPEGETKGTYKHEG